MERVGAYVHAYTSYGSVRPFGISTIVGAIDKTGPQLYVVEPSGAYYGYRACAVGKGRQVAKTELEKLDGSNLTVREGVKEVARMWVFHEQLKSELETPQLTWTCVSVSVFTSFTTITRTETLSSR